MKSIVYAWSALFLLMAVLMAVLAGCADSSTSGSSNGSAADASAESADSGHHHPTEGPHHGALIELGAEEYHGELVHDEANGTVTVWILDGAVKDAVPIEAKEITINLKHDSHGEQFQLTASADAGDPDGLSSRFVSTDGELGEHLHESGVQAVLALTINGRSYSGPIPDGHGHDHGGHDHSGHDHAAHDHARH